MMQPKEGTMDTTHQLLDELTAWIAEKRAQVNMTKNANIMMGQPYPHQIEPGPENTAYPNPVMPSRSQNRCPHCGKLLLSGLQNV
jgi:hypothetical protein